MNQQLDQVLTRIGYILASRPVRWGIVFFAIFTTFIVSFRVYSVIIDAFTSRPPVEILDLEMLRDEVRPGTHATVRVKYMKRQDCPGSYEVRGVWENGQADQLAKGSITPSLPSQDPIEEVWRIIIPGTAEEGRACAMAVVAGLCGDGPFVNRSGLSCFLVNRGDRPYTLQDGDKDRELQSAPDIGVDFGPRARGLNGSGDGLIKGLHDLPPVMGDQPRDQPTVPKETESVD